MAQDLALQQSLLAQGQWQAVELYGLCVPRCPKVGKPEAISDYGSDEGSTDAKAAEWRVRISTAQVFNRCIPRVDKRKSNYVRCASPSCTEVFGPESERCNTNTVDMGDAVVEFGNHTWTIQTSEEAFECDREVDMSVTSMAKQANSGLFLPLLLDYLSTIEASLWRSRWATWHQILVDVTTHPPGCRSSCMCCTRIDASSPSGASPCHSSSPWLSSSSSICCWRPNISALTAVSGITHFRVL